MCSVKTHNNLHPIFSHIAQFLILLTIAVSIHWVVLRFIFPGYYDPLWPLHSDFYLPVEIFNNPSGILSYIHWPRPVGLIFFGLIGSLGLHGALAAIIFVVMLNIVITALFVKTFLEIRFEKLFLIAFSVYAALLFSHPYFYCFYVHDAFSQFSYFLLSCGVLLYSIFLKKSLVVSAVFLFLFSLLAFLAKETFGLSVLGASAVWFLYERKESLVRAALPFLLLFSALVVTFGFSFLVKSAFVTNSNAAYKVDLNPISVMKEWVNYVYLGYNLGTVLLLICIGALSLLKFQAAYQKIHTVFWGCLFAFIAALLPNSLLPGHQHCGYSWTGAYFLFAPVLLLALPGAIPKMTKLAILVVLVFSLFFIQFKNHVRHIDASNRWFLIQEATQRNMLVALQDLIRNVDVKQEEKILVSGLSFPYSPFERPTSLDVYVGDKKITFDIVKYSANVRVAPGGPNVKGISFKDVNLSTYSKIWIFGGDGHLVGALNAQSVPDGFASLETARNYILFPDVAVALGVDFSSLSNLTDVQDGYKLLQAGGAALTYQQSEIALDYFKASSKYIPQNPYPWYLAGVELEKLHRFNEAQEYFQKAVDLDPDGKDPSFRAALLQVEKESKD